MFPIIVFIVNMILTSPYINSKFQKCKSKFRFSLHTLTTETGRYMKTKRLQETTVKDEYHNNLFCLIYDNFRRSYFRDTIGGRGGDNFLCFITENVWTGILQNVQFKQLHMLEHEKMYKQYFRNFVLRMHITFPCNSYFRLISHTSIYNVNREMCFITYIIMH